MTLRNFEVDLRQSTTTDHVVIEEEVSVRSAPRTAPSTKRRAFEGKTPSTWTWRELRDYVIFEIEARTGPLPVSDDKENARRYGIFKGFMSRWGSTAPLIAQYVFERLDGRWLGEPVTIFRFTKDQDPFFAAVIAPRIPGRPVAGW